jgi:hypothetical protein
MLGSLEEDWAFPSSTLAVPTLVMTGLHDRLFRVADDVAATSCCQKAKHIYPTVPPHFLSWVAKCQRRGDPVWPKLLHVITQGGDDVRHTASALQAHCRFESRRKCF